MVCPTPWTSAWAPAWRGWWRWSSASTSGSSRTTPSPAGTTSCPPSSAPPPPVITATILPRPSLPPPHFPPTVRCQTPGRGSPRWRRPPCPLTQDRQVLVQVTRDTAEIVSVRVRRRRASATTGRRTVLTPLRCTSPPVPNTNYIQVCHRKTRPTLRIFPILCHHFLFLLRAISNQQFLTSQRVFPGNLKVWLFAKILIFYHQKCKYEKFRSTTYYHGQGEYQFIITRILNVWCLLTSLSGSLLNYVNKAEDKKKEFGASFIIF